MRTNYKQSDDKRSQINDLRLASRRRVRDRGGAEQFHHTLDRRAGIRDDGQLRGILLVLNHLAKQAVHVQRESDLHADVVFLDQLGTVGPSH